MTEHANVTSERPGWTRPRHEEGESRSAAIERILRETLAVRARRDADRRDLALINDHADALNGEAQDVLTYQVDR